MNAPFVQFIGKIDLTGADAQSLDFNGRHSESSSEPQTENLKKKSNLDGKKEVAMEKEYDVTLVARGNVRVETMSWIQVIRSKYGFDDAEGTGEEAGRKRKGALPPGQVGRTASASMAAAELARKALEE